MKKYIQKLRLFIFNNIASRKTSLDILYIQFPRILFTTFIVYMSWKIQDKIYKINKKNYYQYENKSFRQEKISEDIKYFENIINNINTEDITDESEEEKQLRLFSERAQKEAYIIKMNKLERDFSILHDYSDYNKEELNNLKEFEEWAENKKTKQDLYTKKHYNYK